MVELQENLNQRKEKDNNNLIRNLKVMSFKVQLLTPKLLVSRITLAATGKRQLLQM